LPLARRVIGLAVNQTIMMAHGMVVITALIAAPGLGVDIIRALSKVDTGSAFDAGLAIVILAVVLDRLTWHANNRLDPRSRRHGSRALGRTVTLATVAFVAVVAIAGQVAASTEFPPTVHFSFRGPVNDLSHWIETNLYWLTDTLKNLTTDVVLNPLQGLLTSTPWWLLLAAVFAVSFRLSGVRSAVAAGACLVLMALLQLWQHSMETLASVIVATAITLAIGVAVGVLTARSDRLATILRPTLDAAQTMPSLVYLLPAVALFGATRFTAIVAAVIYAAPPVIRLVESGIRGVSATVVEAATAAGATDGQLLAKVQLPLARRSILVAANQGIVMVLAMVVVGGLVGAGGLGYDVVAGFAQRRDFGQGLAAGLCIVLLGIMVDRITQGAGRRREARTASG
jgi:glycine betaine/proline transport system permease protein